MPDSTHGQLKPSFRDNSSQTTSYRACLPPPPPLTDVADALLCCFTKPMLLTQLCQVKNIYKHHLISENLGT